MNEHETKNTNEVKPAFDGDVGTTTGAAELLFTCAGENMQSGAAGEGASAADVEGKVISASGESGDEPLVEDDIARKKVGSVTPEMNPEIVEESIRRRIELNIEPGELSEHDEDDETVWDIFYTSGADESDSADDEIGADTVRARAGGFLAGLSASIKKQSVYTAVFCTLCAVGILAAVLFGRGGSPEESQGVSGSNDQSISQAIKPSPTFTLDSDEYTLPSQTRPGIVPDFTQAPPTSNPGVKQLLPPPLEGAVIWEFAIDELVYSETLDCWMTHAGVDIACKVGDTVRSVAAGTVERVFEDDELGYTVIIDHGNGHKTLYASLAAEIPVSEGENVAANAAIGSCGNTARSECATPPHIHFEYYVDGVCVDPVGMVRLGGNR